MAECGMACSLSIPIATPTPTPIALRPPIDRVVHVISEPLLTVDIRAGGARPGQTRGRSLSLRRLRSTASAHWRPSRIAQRRRVEQAQRFHCFADCLDGNPSPKLRLLLANGGSASLDPPYKARRATRGRRYRLGRQHRNASNWFLWERSWWMVACAAAGSLAHFALRPVSLRRGPVQGRSSSLRCGRSTLTRSAAPGAWLRAKRPTDRGWPPGGAPCRDGTWGGKKVLAPSLPRMVRGIRRCSARSRLV